MINALITFASDHPFISLALGFLVLIMLRGMFARIGRTGVPAASIHVIDGDTFSLAMKARGTGTPPRMRVRPIGYDAPEMPQPHGKEAAAELRRAIKDAGGVSLAERGTDQYDRVLADVRLGVDGKGKSLAAHMIQAGYGHPETASAIAYFVRTLPARIAGRGMWTGFILLRLFGYGVISPRAHRRAKAMLAHPEMDQLTSRYSSRMVRVPKVRTFSTRSFTRSASFGGRRGRR